MTSRNALFLFATLFLGCTLMQTEARIDVDTLVDHVIDTSDVITHTPWFKKTTIVTKLRDALLTKLGCKVSKIGKLMESQSKELARGKEGGAPRQVNNNDMINLGDWVEVQVLDDKSESGENLLEHDQLSRRLRPTGEWILAQVTGLHLDGRFDLALPDGTAVKPALDSGIRSHHLRPVSPSRVAAAKANVKALNDLTAAQNAAAKQNEVIEELQGKVKEAKERAAKTAAWLRAGQRDKRAGAEAPSMRRPGCKVAGMP